jgi:hypothetical protein
MAITEALLKEIIVQAANRPTVPYIASSQYHLTLSIILNLSLLRRETRQPAVTIAVTSDPTG